MGVKRAGRSLLVEQGKQFVSRLGEALSRDTAHVDEVFYRVDTTSLEGKKLLYLSPDGAPPPQPGLQVPVSLV